MTIVSNSVIFDLPAPDKNVIVSTVEKVSGLSVNVEDGDHCDDDLHDMSLSIAFLADPQNTLTIYSYKAGAVVNSVVEETDADHEQYIPVLLTDLEGADEKKGQQSIYMSTYLGCDLTLYYATTIALESLNGAIKRPINLETIKAQFPITEDQLKKNIKKHQWMRFVKLFVQLILLPITLLFMVLSIIKSIVKLPFDVYKLKKQMSSENKTQKNN